MSGFTPGPWEAPTAPYQRIDGDGVNFSGGDWEVVPPLGEFGPVAITNCEANARLIAAAPEMYELLHAIWLSDATDSYCEWCRAHAPKDEHGMITGRIVHRGDCNLVAVYALINRIDGEPGG